MTMFLAVDARKLAPFLLAVPLIAFSLFLRDAEEPVPAAAAARPAQVLIIDAGHGGEDGGASSQSGLAESGVNLDIALRLRALAVLCGVEPVMTRTAQEIGYPPDAGTTAKRKAADQHTREALINSYPDGVLISIHQNCFPDPRPSGCQVLYAASDGSRELGELTHANLCAALCPDNRRVAAPAAEDIYLMRTARCTAILVECGFLSNREEAEKLATPEYQIRISAALLASYLQYAARPGNGAT